MSKIKTTAVLLTTFGALLTLTACGGSISAPKSDTSALSAVSKDGSTKYPLSWTDTDSYINDKGAGSSDATGSQLIVAYLNNDTEQTIRLTLDSEHGNIDGDYSYKETVLTDIDTEPYVTFSKKDDITEVHVYRQPWVRYNQAPVSGTVADK